MAAIQPTYQGFIYNTRDALLVINKVITGEFKPINRRPHDREREAVIRSGNVFVYNENTSSIKRWTDGVSWSPSRIIGNFLLYRELEKMFPPGEKRKATDRSERTKRKRSEYDDHEACVGDNRLGHINTPLISPDGRMNIPVRAAEPDQPSMQLSRSAQHHNEFLAFIRTPEFKKSLFGSLVDSYHFKGLDGLCKKTISVKHGGDVWHLVSYYVAEDAMSGRLIMPRFDPEMFENVTLPQQLCDQPFRVTVDANGNETNNQTPVHQLRASPVGGGGFQHPSRLYSGIEPDDPHHNYPTYNPLVSGSTYLPSNYHPRHGPERPPADQLAYTTGMYSPPSYAPGRGSYNYYNSPTTTTPATVNGVYGQQQRDAPRSAQLPVSDLAVSHLESDNSASTYFVPPVSAQAYKSHIGSDANETSTSSARFPVNGTTPTSSRISDTRDENSRVGHAHMGYNNVYPFRSDSLSDSSGMLKVEGEYYNGSWN